MNKKEIAEIKKQFTPANCTITRICGCYVDAEKNKKTKIKEAFLSLPEEEMFKYFDIFKKTMSGRLGKNLMNLDFPLSQEKEGGTQEFLMRIRASKLKNDELLEEFYDKVIENYDYHENYYIVLIHAVYDIPGKASDGTEMHDASEEIYEHILCSICPVNLSKAVALDNIHNSKTVKIVTPDATICIQPDKIALIELKEINGVPSLVIPVNGELKINGIEVEK